MKIRVRSENFHFQEGGVAPAGVGWKSFGGQGARGVFVLLRGINFQGG